MCLPFHHEGNFIFVIYIIRLNEDRTKTHISVNLESVLKDGNHKDNIYLKEYDIVRVLSIDDFYDEFYVSVLGAVRSGGEFDFGVGMTLQDVLLQSGGLTQQAEGSRVEVSRILDYDISTNELTKQLLDHESPSYTRTARNKTPRMYDDDSVKNLRIGKGSVLREGSDIAIIACGVMVHKAVIAANNLSEEGIDVCVVDMHTIKPLDTNLIDKISTTCRGIVTVEDHSVIGGLGSSISEYLSGSNPTKITRMGVEDRFGESGGSEELLDLVGLTVERIEDACRNL